MATREQRIKWIAKEFIDSEISFFDFATHNGNIQICAVDNKWMLKVLESNQNPYSVRDQGVLERDVSHQSLEGLLNSLTSLDLVSVSDGLGFVETPEMNAWYNKLIIIQQTFIDDNGNEHELNNNLFVTQFKTEEQLNEDANAHWGNNWTGLTYRLWYSKFDGFKPEIRELFDKDHLKAVIKKSSKEIA